MGKIFTKEDSQTLKGMAICMLLYRHLFGNVITQGVTVDYFLINEVISKDITCFCKLCLPMFIFVTGYGIAAKIGYQEIQLRDMEKVTVRRFASLMIPFWFIFIICQIFGNITGVDGFFDTYGNGKGSVIYCFLDFLGLAQVLDTPTMCGTWWYISFALLLMVALPMVCLVVRKFSFMPLLVLFFLFGYLDVLCPILYFQAGVIGITAYYCDLFGRVDDCIGNNTGRNIGLIAVILLILALCFVLRTEGGYDNFVFLIGTPAIVLLQQRYIARFKLFNVIMGFLGKHSLNIFLTHTFLKSHYLNRLIFGCRYGILIWAVLIILSLILSIILEWLMKVLKVKTLINRINRIN